MLESDYQQKKQDYYEGYRKDILPLLPRHSGRVLEVGCGTGNTLVYLKTNGYCDWACGVDLFPNAVAEAAIKLDQVYHSNIEKMELPIEPGSIDMILCLDVLEHLVNPHNVIQYLHTLLVPGGIIIASIPNIGYFSFGLRLLLQNKWEYEETGILDKTHLRFFVKKTAIELMKSSGLSLLDVRSYPMNKRNSFLNSVTLGVFESRLTTQYLIKVVN